MNHVLKTFLFLFVIVERICERINSTNKWKYDHYFNMNWSLIINFQRNDLNIETIFDISMRKIFFEIILNILFFDDLYLMKILKFLFVIFKKVIDFQFLIF
jgi:hypothetical protein